MSAGLKPDVVIATDRRPGAGSLIRVGIIGATGYGGGELIRLLSRHPQRAHRRARGRDRLDEPVGDHHAHLAHD